MRHLVTLTQLIVGICVSDCLVVITPRNKAVVAGQRMEMECRTNSGWFVRQWWFHCFFNPAVIKKFDVYNISRLYAAERLSPSGYGVDVDWNGSGVFYSNETKVEHAGIYACRAESTDGKDSVYSAALVVIHSEPVCETNTSEDYVVMQCKVHFRGGWSPTVEWKQHGTDASEEYLVTNVTHANNYFDRTITSSLLISLGSIKCDSYFTFITYFEWHNNSIRVDATNIPNFNYTWNSHNLSATCYSTMKNTTGIAEMNTGDPIYTNVAILSVIFFMVAVAISIIVCVVVRTKTAAVGCDLLRHNISSADNVVRQSTGDYEEINELNTTIESPITNPVQSAGYSGLIRTEHIRQQAYETIIRQEAYETIIRQESPAELNEQQNLYSAVDEYKYNVIVHTDESEEICAHGSDDGDDGRHNESICDHEEPHCEKGISPEYLTIII